MSISRLMQMAAAGAGGDYQISRSLRFNSADSAYLSRTFGSGNRQIFTWSSWVKLGKVPFSAIGYSFSSRQSATDNLGIGITTGSAIQIDRAVGGSSIQLTTTPVYRDPSAWYHIVIAVDTTQATAANRIKPYVNGVQVTVFSTSTYPSQNDNLAVNLNTAVHTIGGYNGANNLWDGYQTECHFIDGQQLAPSSFGETNETTGVWSPIQFNGPWNVGTGVNGFYLNFSDNSDVTAATLGKDDSGNGNNWTPNNFSVTAGAGNDSLVDTPTPYGTDTGAGGEVRGNYCTLNPLSGGGSADPTNGNLDQTVSGAALGADTGTFLLTTGKWYWEITSTLSTNDAAGIGILRANLPAITFFTTNPSGVYYYVNGDKYIDGTGSAYGATWNTLGTAFNIAVALDVDGGTVTFYKNGASQGAITLPSNTNGWLAHSGFGSASGSTAANFNFGQRPFAYTAPSGFKALVTTNLPTPTVVQGNKYFDTKLWAGNSSTQSIALEFAPGWIWNKSTGDTAGHAWWDVLRGTGALISSQSTDAETTGYNAITSFGSNAISLGADNTGSLDGRTNETGRNYVGWVWKAGVSNVTNEDGTIDSTVSVSTTSGFSIVKYTKLADGNSVGHGLGVTPAFIIQKITSGTGGWLAVHQNMNAGGLTSGYLLLNTTDAFTSNANVFTAVTSTTFTVGSVISDADQIAYCFAEVEGFSKFSSYTGNGLADGPFVYTGFRPAWVMVKLASGGSGSSNWSVFDTSRNPYNLTTQILAPNASDAEFTAADSQIDILSNGIKLRSSTFSFGINQSGVTYIYAAFAENPFKTSLAR